MRQPQGQQAGAGNTPHTDDMVASLTCVARQYFASDATVFGLERLGGGASQELWAFSVQADGTTHRFVLRRNPGGVARAIAAGMDIEAQTIRLAQEAGVPVPALLHSLAACDRLGCGYIMARIEGETLPPRILRDPIYAQARTKLPYQLGQAAARIHGIVSHALRALPARTSLADTEALYRAQGVARPVVEWALRWLWGHLPAADTPLCVVHGDYRHGNIIVGPEGLRAIIDWEGVHLGEAMEDLGYLCVPSWRFGQIDLPVGGLGSREGMIAGYEAAGGKVDIAAMRFWEVFGTLRWGVICGVMADEFASGDPSVEKAAVGRRASETALDLLAILAPGHRYRHA